MRLLFFRAPLALLSSFSFISAAFPVPPDRDRLASGRRGRSFAY
jgi:hypothetical protein